MIQKFKNSWNLIERSISILMRSPKLLVFPIVTIISTLTIFLFFFGLFLLQPTGHDYTDKAHWKAISEKVFTRESLEAPTASESQSQQLEYNKTGLLIVTGLYFFAMFLATFFNVAFYHEIIEALNGRPVSLRQGFGFARTRLKAILLWSLLAGLVGYLIKQIESRVGFLGKIVVNLIGLAWSVTAVFAIPVMICNTTVDNPITILKTSAASLKKTWGETLIGFVGLHWASFLVIVMSAVPFFALIVTGGFLKMPSLSIISILGWSFFIFTFIYVAGVASNIYQCALYLFASTGQVPSDYNREQMDLAWAHKK